MEMSSSTIISLTWNDHHKLFKQIFGKFLESSTLVDCIISAEGQSLKAHKIVLAACSHYFEMLFSEERVNNSIVILKDIKFQHLKMLLYFMYNGKVKLPQDQFRNFLDAAQSLQIKGLEDTFKKHEIRKTIEESKLGNESSIHSSVTLSQMQNNYSAMNEEDEAGLSLGISKLSVNSENLVECQISNTVSSFQTSVAQASSKLCAAKLRKRDISKTKIRMESEFQTYLPKNNHSVHLTNAEHSEETAVFTVTEMTPRVMTEREIKSAKMFEMEMHLNSVHSLTPKRFLKRISQADDHTEPEVIDITTSETITDFISPPAPPKQLQNKPYGMCCEKESQKPDKLKTYIQKCKRKSAHLCGDCKKSFSSTSTLRIHQHLLHKSRYHYITLQECGELLKWPVNFRMQQHVHKGFLPFICQYCQKAFMKMKQLKKHLHIHEAGSFVCQECGEAFTTEVDLQNHLHFHTGVSVLACPECGKAFTHNVRFQRHLYFHNRKHSAITKIKMY